MAFIYDVMFTGVSKGEILWIEGVFWRLVWRLARRRHIRLIDLNEYKRKQAAPGLKITGRAFGFGRRMPIAQRYDNRRAVETGE